MFAINSQHHHSPIELIRDAMNGAQSAIFNGRVGVHAIACGHFDVIDLAARSRIRIDEKTALGADALPGIAIADLIQQRHATFRSVPGEHVKVPEWIMTEGENCPADYYNKNPAYPHPTMADLKRELPGLLEILASYRARTSGTEGMSPWESLSRPNRGNCGDACSTLAGEMIKRFGHDKVKVRGSDTCFLSSPLDQGHAYFTVDVLPDSGTENLFQRPSRVIVDFTWIQYFAAELPGPSVPPAYTFPEELIDAVPLPFVGTRDEMAEILEAHSAFTTHSLGKQKLNVLECVKQLYQFRE